MTDRTRRQVLLGLAFAGGTGLLLTAVGSWLSDIDTATAVDSYGLTNVAFALGFGGCGLLIALHRPRNPVGWLMLLGGLAHLTTATIGAWQPYAVEAGWPSPVLRLMATVFFLAWPFGIGLAFPLALILFPDGRPASPVWGRLTWVYVAAGVLFVLRQGVGDTEETFPGAGLSYLPGLPEPLGVAIDLFGSLVTLSVVGSLVVRYRRGTEIERRQLLWLSLALVVALALNLQRWVTNDGPILPLLTFQLIPVAVLIAVLRHGLLDIRLVLSRTVAYLVLTATILASYAGLVSLVGNVASQRTGDLGTTGLIALAVALAFNPLRIFLQRLTDRFFYGARRDPVRAIAGSAIGWLRAPAS